MSQQHAVAELLAGRVPLGETVTVKGWVRTRRDSKAGVSFVHVSDGSAFDPIQVVAPSTLPNYAQDVARLSAGFAEREIARFPTQQGSGAEPTFSTMPASTGSTKCGRCNGGLR